MKPIILCMDMESVLTPEIWEEVAKRTWVNELLLTTKDIADYNKLMNHRLEHLNKNWIGLSVIEDVVSTIEPLPWAADFLSRARSKMQVIVLSDTFIEIAKPLVTKLWNPTIFSHNILIDNDKIVDYKLRISDQKTKSVEKFKELNFTTIAVGDSLNDTGMLKMADYWYFFNPWEKARNEFPDIPVINSFEELKLLIDKII